MADSQFGPYDATGYIHKWGTQTSVVGNTDCWGLVADDGRNFTFYLGTVYVPSLVTSEWKVEGKRAHILGTLWDKASTGGTCSNFPAYPPLLSFGIKVTTIESPPVAALNVALEPIAPTVYVGATVPVKIIVTNDSAINYPGGGSVSGNVNGQIFVTGTLPAIAAHSSSTTISSVLPASSGSYSVCASIIQ